MQWEADDERTTKSYRRTYVSRLLRASDAALLLLDLDLLLLLHALLQWLTVKGTINDNLG